MIFYKDDPKLALKVITTISGEKEYRRNCRYINGRFYVMNKDCFEIDETWYRVESGKIHFDHEQNKWVLQGTTKLIRGVVGFKSPTDVVMGFFSPNYYNNIRVDVNGHTNECINIDVLPKDVYFENLATCVWIRKDSVSLDTIHEMQKIRSEGNFTHKGYNIEDNFNEFELKKKTYAEFPTKISKEVIKYAKFLGNVTFGGEVETSMGNLPNNLQYQLGLVACRDGSISSAEWVSVPMCGAKGVQNIINISDVLSARTNVDMSCSLHYHFGNVPTERLYLITMYMLTYAIQDELFKMFPYYKTDHRGIKKKNYCQKLKHLQIHPLKDFSKEAYNTYIDEVYIKLFTFLSDGTLPSEAASRKYQQHPIKNKWDRPSRYYWLNLQNMIFSPRLTVEFRLHSATTNKYKMVSWLYICNALVRYAEINAKKILAGEKITLIDVLNYYKDVNPNNKNAHFLSNYLIAYYKKREEAFAADLNQENFISEWDIQDDKIFTFHHEYKCLF